MSKKLVLPFPLSSMSGWIENQPIPPHEMDEAYEADEHNFKSKPLDEGDVTFIARYLGEQFARVLLCSGDFIDINKLGAKLHGASSFAELVTFDDKPDENYVHMSTSAALNADDFYNLLHRLYLIGKVEPKEYDTDVNP